MGYIFAVIYLLGQTFYITINADHLRKHECPSNIPTSVLVSKYEHTCLQIVAEQKTWTEAREYCQRFHGDLVRVESAAKQEFIMLQLRRNAPDRAWIGASDQVEESKWIWVTGDGVQKHYQNWKPGEGTMHRGLLFSKTAMLDDCALLDFSDRGQWEDRPCSLRFFRYNFICEYAQISLNKVHTHEPDTLPSTKEIFSQPITSYTLTTLSKLTSTAETMHFPSTRTDEYPMSSTTTRKTILPENSSSRMIKNSSSKQMSTQNSWSSQAITNNHIETTASNNVSLQSDTSSTGLSEKSTSMYQSTYNISNGTKGNINGYTTWIIVWFYFGVVVALIL